LGTAVTLQLYSDFAVVSSGVRLTLSADSIPVCTAASPYEMENNRSCVSSCPAGMILDSARLLCVGCAAGTASDGLSCRACEPGTFSAYGATACVPCLPGTWGNSSGTAYECTSCAAGTYNPLSGQVSAAACLPCPAGSQCSANSSSATTCDKGTYANSSSSACTQCAPGTASAIYGAASCAACAAGSRTSSPGSAECVSCIRGSSSTAGTSQCTTCDNTVSTCNATMQDTIFITLAGDTSASGYLDAVGTAAIFSGLRGLAVNASVLFVCDSTRIRKVTSDGTVTTLAGSDISGLNDGQGTRATFTSPESIALGPAGLYVTDNDRVRIVSATGTVSTIKKPSGWGYLTGIAVDDRGIFVADGWLSALRAAFENRITPFLPSALKHKVTFTAMFRAV
jgi:hypothetical protein